MPGRGASLCLAAAAAVFVCSLAALAGAASSPSPVRPRPPAGFVVQELASVPRDLEVRRYLSTVSFAFAPDGRLFAAQKYGVVKVFDGAAWHEWLDLSDEVNDWGDRGLLSIAVSPRYAQDRRVFLFYTRKLDVRKPPDDGPASGRLISVASSAGDPNRADESTRRVLVEARPASPAGFDSHAIFHSVAGLAFDRDGNLLAGFGDGASTADVQPRALAAQDPGSLAGKVLRLDPDTGAGVPGNPFFDPRRPASNRSRVYALGFRNPFRLSVDPGSGRAYVGDVGWGTWEELDLVEPGAAASRNFGWPCFEGGSLKGRPAALPQRAYQRSRATGRRCAAVGPTAAPAAVLPHGGPHGNAIVVGPVVSGTRYPAAYRGRVFVADYAADRMFTFDPATGRLGPFGAGPWGNVVDLRLTPQGTVAFLALPFEGTGGRIYEIVHAGSNRPPRAVVSGPARASVGATVSLSAARSADPEGGPLAFRWDFGDGSPAGEGAAADHVFEQPGTFEVALTVTDRSGLRARQTLTIDVDNTRPTVRIVSPAAGQPYRVGTKVVVRLDARDAEDPAGRPRYGSRWQVVLHHTGHVHYVTPDYGEGGSFVVPDHGDDAWLEVRATTTDAGGAVAGTAVRMRPVQVRVRVRSTAGSPIVAVDESRRRAPATWSSTVGGHHTLVAPERLAGGLRFAGWIVNGARRPGTTLRFTTPARPLEIVARYERG